MTILLSLIPVMILAVAIATVPILYAMRLEERERRVGMAQVLPIPEPGEPESALVAA
jgi:hypothetical protein